MSRVDELKQWVSCSPNWQAEGVSRRFIHSFAICTTSSYSTQGRLGLTCRRSHLILRTRVQQPLQASTLIETTCLPVVGFLTQVLVWPPLPVLAKPPQVLPHLTCLTPFNNLIWTSRIGPPLSGKEVCSHMIKSMLLQSSLLELSPD